MRIMIVTFDPPQNVGGIEGRAVHYASELSSMGHPVEVVSVSRGRGETSESFHGGTLHKLSSSPKALARTLGSVMKISSTRSVQAVFLLSGGLTLPGISILACSRLMGLRTAVFFYGKDLLSARGTPAWLLLLASGATASRFVVNSKYTRTLLPSWMGARAEVLYPGVDPASAIAIEDSPVEGKVVLFVGRLVERKGLETLLHAFRKVVVRVPDARLEVVGDGPAYASTRALAGELGIGDHVSMPGTLRGDALSRAYARADVFVMVPKSEKRDVEGFGTVYLEAGLFSKPVIGSFSGGVPEAVEDGITGFLVREGDDEELSARILELLADEAKARRMGEAGRRRAIESFSWSKGASELLKILS